MPLHRLLKVLLIGLLPSISYAAHSNGENHHQTLYVVAKEWLGYTEKNGHGLYFNLIKRIYETEGYTVKTQIMPFKRAIGYINLAKADILLADDDLQYLAKLNTYQIEKILQPLYPLNNALITAIYPKATGLNWPSIRSNNKLTLAWINGYGYGQTLALPHQKIYFLNSTQQGLKLLHSGRIDCLIDDLTDLEISTKRMNLNMDGYHFDVISHRHLYPIFSNTPRGIKLMQVYEKTMETMIESGEIFELYKTYKLNYHNILSTSSAGHEH
ncbi:hypothetical protein [Dasania marina]|mgnify:CR=1 FL=1|uniref:substrate-binding periplasmic protein n=1 Tax=Dasania marina TaxID=471499 RepID=UPI0030DDA599|tara:strand:+ start:21899 stop:22708 length:810 start_codon:yes stop_codon:yes gene_type:complete